MLICQSLKPFNATFHRHEPLNLTVLTKVPDSRQLTSGSLVLALQLTLDKEIQSRLSQGTWRSQSFQPVQLFCRLLAIVARFPALYLRI